MRLNILIMLLGCPNLIYLAPFLDIQERKKKLTIEGTKKENKVIKYNKIAMKKI